MRELSGPLSLLIEMVSYCSYCNEPFSLGVLQFLKVRAESVANRTRHTRVGAERPHHPDLVSVRPSWRRRHLMN